MSDQPLTAIIQIENPSGKTGRRQTITADAGQTILEALGREGVIINQVFIALINGKTNDLDYVLAPGDKVILLPQIGGGSI